MLSYVKNMLFDTESQENKSTDHIPVKGTEQNTKIKVNSKTDNPNYAWDLIKNKVNHTIVEPLSLETPIFENKVRFVCISDTHSKTENLASVIPAGDILIHAGDFTLAGSPDCIRKFSNFLQELNDRFKYKVVIAGNHELSFDENCKHPRQFKKSDNTKSLLNNCIYLEDSYVELFGFKIYGSPWQPWFHDWAYNLKRGDDCLKKWNMIPEDTDVLITHGPPLGYGDVCRGGIRAGCCELLSTIQDRVKPKYHICGHIHEDYGMLTDGTTTYINASTCSLKYEPTNLPIIFDLELPENVSKNDFLV